MFERFYAATNTEKQKPVEKAPQSHANINESILDEYDLDLLMENGVFSKTFELFMADVQSGSLTPEVEREQVELLEVQAKELLRDNYRQGIIGTLRQRYVEERTSFQEAA